MWGSRYEAQDRYDASNTTQVKLKLNYKTDADIIKWIRAKKRDSNSTIQGTIKALIRKQIASEQLTLAEKEVDM